MFWLVIDNLQCAAQWTQDVDVISLLHITGENNSETSHSSTHVQSLQMIHTACIPMCSFCFRKEFSFAFFWAKIGRVFRKLWLFLTKTRWSFLYDIPESRISLLGNKMLTESYWKLFIPRTLDFILLQEVNTNAVKLHISQNNCDNHGFKVNMYWYSP